MDYKIIIGIVLVIIVVIILGIVYANSQQETRYQRLFQTRTISQMDLSLKKKLADKLDDMIKNNQLFVILLNKSGIQKTFGQTELTQGVTLSYSDLFTDSVANLVILINLSKNLVMKFENQKNKSVASIYQTLEPSILGLGGDMLVKTNDKFDEDQTVKITVQ